MTPTTRSTPRSTGSYANHSCPNPEAKVPNSTSVLTFYCMANHIPSTHDHRHGGILSVLQDDYAHVCYGCLVAEYNITKKLGTWKTLLSIAVASKYCTKRIPLSLRWELKGLLRVIYLTVLQCWLRIDFAQIWRWIQSVRGMDRRQQKNAQGVSRKGFDLVEQKSFLNDKTTGLVYTRIYIKKKEAKAILVSI